MLGFRWIDLAPAIMALGSTTAGVRASEAPAGFARIITWFEIVSPFSTTSDLPFARAECEDDVPTRKIARIPY